MTVHDPKSQTAPSLQKPVSAPHIHAQPSPKTPLDEFGHSCTGMPETTAQADPPAKTRRHSFTVLHWLCRIFATSFLQAAALVATIWLFSDIFLIFIPLTLFLRGEAWGDFAIHLFLFAGGCFFIAMKIPANAFWRGALAFLWAGTLEITRMHLQHTTFGVFTFCANKHNSLFGFIGLGMLICAFSAAIGARMHKDMKGWLQEEFAEFFESIGILPEDHPLHSNNLYGNE